MEARRRAMEADVVVVNHHLFFADVVLRDEGAGELLPASNAVILDEAHQLPETASLFFGESVSTAQLLELARDARVAAMAHARDFAPLPAAVQALEKAARAHVWGYCISCGGSVHPRRHRQRAVKHASIVGEPEKARACRVG